MRRLLNDTNFTGCLRSSTLLVLVQSSYLPLLWPAPSSSPSRRKAACMVSVVVSKRSGLCLSLAEHLIRKTQYCMGVTSGYLLILEEEESKCRLDLQSLPWAEVVQGEPSSLPAYLKRDEMSRGLLRKTWKRIFALPYSGGLIVFWYSVKICNFYFHWEN